MERSPQMDVQYPVTSQMPLQDGGTQWSQRQHALWGRHVAAPSICLRCPPPATPGVMAGAGKGSMRLEVAGGVPHQHQEISVGLGSLAPGWDAPWLHLPTQNHLGQDLRLPGLRVPSGCPWAQQHLSHARIKLWVTQSGRVRHDHMPTMALRVWGLMPGVSTGPH